MRCIGVRRGKPRPEEECSEPEGNRGSPRRQCFWRGRTAGPLNCPVTAAVCKGRDCRPRPGRCSNNRSPPEMGFSENRRFHATAGRPDDAFLAIGDFEQAQALARGADVRGLRRRLNGANASFQPRGVSRPEITGTSCRRSAPFPDGRRGHGRDDDPVRAMRLARASQRRGAALRNPALLEPTASPRTSSPWR